MKTREESYKKFISELQTGETVKVCLNCTYYGSGPWSGRGPFVGCCLSPKTKIKISRVNGSSIPTTASLQRKWGFLISFLLSRCGKTGRFFEQKPDSKGKVSKI